MYSQSNTNRGKCQISLGFEAAERMAERKALARVVASIYDETCFWQYGGLIRGCADSMIVRRLEGGEQEIAYTLFCGARLCPICSWRRSLKAYNQLSRCMDAMDAARISEGRKPWKYLLITLTMRNCAGADLPDMIQHLYDSYVRLNHREEWKAAIKGAWRTLEVTYNPQEDTYHPHLHVFCVVNPSYFTDKTYISQSRLIQLWQSCLKVGYAPSVRMERVVVKEGRKDLHEVTKYVTKSAQLVTQLPEAVAVDVLQNLHAALHGRKLYAAYGEIRRTMRALRMTDEDGDLLNVADDDGTLAAEIRADLKYTLETYIYRPGDGYVRIDDFAALVDPNIMPHHLQMAMIKLQHNPNTTPAIPLEEE